MSNGSKAISRPTRPTSAVASAPQPTSRTASSTDPWRADAEPADALIAEGNGITTARLSLRPVGPEHLPDLIALKADEAAFGLMLHGVRSPRRTREELEDDMEFWLVRGYGTWSVFERASGDFLGIVGFMERPDGRGVALRFAFWPARRGQGFAREAAAAALRFGHRRGLRRIIAIARESNAASRGVLTDIGMRACGEFRHQGHRMLVFESPA